VVTSTAVALADTDVAFTVNPAAAEPAATGTEDGIVRLEPAASPVVIVSPPAGAAADIPAVHAADPGVITVAGVQASEVRVYGWLMLTCPPVAVTARGSSLADTPIPLVNWITEEVLTVDGDTVNVAVAITPPAMAVLFRPARRQV
jgi:hypothetical protein